MLSSECSCSVVKCSSSFTVKGNVSHQNGPWPNWHSPFFMSDFNCVCEQKIRLTWKVLVWAIKCFDNTNLFSQKGFKLNEFIGDEAVDVEWNLTGLLEVQSRAMEVAVFEITFLFSSKKGSISLCTDTDFFKAAIFFLFCSFLCTFLCSFLKCNLFSFDDSCCILHILDSLRMIL